jgi:hypothetical protein
MGGTKRPGERFDGVAERTLTVVVAGAANLAIAIAKAIAGVVHGP